MIPLTGDAEQQQSLESGSCTKQTNPHSSPSQSSPSGDSLDEHQLPPATSAEEPHASSGAQKIEPRLANSSTTTSGTTCASEVGLMLASCSSGYGSTVSACDSATATLACNSATGDLPFNPFAIVPFSLVCSETQTQTQTQTINATECSTTPSAIENLVAAPPAESVLFAPDSAFLPDPSILTLPISTAATLTLPNASDSLEQLDSLSQPTVELQLAAPADEECELVCHSPSRVHSSASSECLQPGVKGVSHSTSLHVISRPSRASAAAPAPAASDSTGGTPLAKTAPRRTPLTNSSAAGDTRRHSGAGQRPVGPSVRHSTSSQKPASQPSRAKINASKAK